MRRVMLVAVVAGLVAACSSSLTVADVVMNSPDLPPVGNDVNGNPTGYRTPAMVHAQYNGVPVPMTSLTADVTLRDINHRPLNPVMRTPVGPDEIEQFPSEATGTGDVVIPGFGTIPNIPLMLSGPVETIVFNKVGNTTGTFQTEMLSLSLTGSVPVPLPGGTLPVAIRESPTLPSRGQTTIQDLGGGLYRIDSFFDVFTELSIDGGMTWTPSQGSTHVVLSSVPEAHQWLLLMAAAVGGLGVRAVRRRCA
jgi:hypothetical protein